MKLFYKYLALVLLTFVIGAKIVVPVFSSDQYAEKADTEQEQKSVEEKAPEKSIHYKTDLTDVFLQPVISNQLPGKNYYSFIEQHSFLPVQFFAIPTPPPWFRS